MRNLEKLNDKQLVDLRVAADHRRQTAQRWVWVYQGGVEDAEVDLLIIDREIERRKQHKHLPML